MNEAVLQKVLACSRLPSLPTVAVRVIELTSDQNVSLRKIADTIQNDQGLATRILRTVNSPFYGLSKRCATISQAQILLGLSGIKTLALGFSLVASLKQETESGFDYEAYWRRAVYAAVGAKAAAQIMQCPCAEEAFLGGLIQDIGMIALSRALGEQYNALVRECGAEHHRLSALEQSALGAQHAEIGALLAERWRIPDALVAPIRHHEAPDLAPAPHAAVVRCVSLGALAAAALSEPRAGAMFSDFRLHAVERLQIAPERADELLGHVAKGAAELSALLNVSIGHVPDVNDLLESARDRLVDITLERVQAAEQTARANERLQQEILTDSLTGAASQSWFREAVAEAFGRAVSTGQPLSVVAVSLDSLHRVHEERGWAAGDALLGELARRLQEGFRPWRGVVGRCGAEEFGLVIERTDRATAASLLQEFCDRAVHLPFAPEGCEGAGGPVGMTVSIGLATRDGPTADVFGRAEQLVSAAARALQAARTAGGGCVRVFSPISRAAA